MKYDGVRRLDWSRSAYGQEAGSCKRGNELPSSTKKSDEFDKLRNC